jgi:hypothetical protein
MSITLKNICSIGFKVFRWLSGAKAIINNGSTIEQIHAELYRNDQWAIFIEIRRIDPPQK